MSEDEKQLFDFRNNIQMIQNEPQLDGIGSPPRNFTNKRKLLRIIYGLLLYICVHGWLTMIILSKSNVILLNLAKIRRPFIQITYQYSGYRTRSDDTAQSCDRCPMCAGQCNGGVANKDSDI